MSNYKNGSIIGVDNTPTTSLASGVWDLNSVRDFEDEGVWPIANPASVTVTDTDVNSSDLDTYTFSAKSFGAAVSGRRIIVAIGSLDTASQTIDAVTIGGVSATEIASGEQLGNTGYSKSALYIAEVPTGTTGDVVVEYSAEVLDCALVVMRAVNLESSTATDTITDDTSSGTTYSGTLDISAGGIAVGAFFYFRQSGLGGVTWAGLTEGGEQGPSPTTREQSWALDDFASAQTGLTVSATVSVDPDSGALVAASFR